MKSTSHSKRRRRIFCCQPCRQRKIRCTQDGPPCQACRCRGAGEEDCIYLGFAPKDPPSSELFAKIQNLEARIQELTATQASTISDNAIPPLSALMASGSFPETMARENRGSSIPDYAGALQTSRTGSVRYSSLASWESVVANSPSAACLQSFGLDTATEDDPQIQLVCNGGVSRAELLGLLPPRPVCDTLTATYFRVISPVFHILHNPTFEAEYQQFCQDPGILPTSWLVLLFAVLAISISAQIDNDTLLFDLGRERTVDRNIKVLFTRYRSAALRCLAIDNVMNRHSINSLQALVLIIYASLHRNIPCWTLLGLTHHVSMSMGCHIDPERFKLGTIECEERRRIWAGLTILYTLQNTLFGNLNQQITTQDVNLPAEVNDVEPFTVTTIPYPSSISSSPYTVHLTQTTYLCLAYHLNRMSNRICEYISSYMCPRYPLATLEAELEVLRERCDALYTRDCSQEPLPAYHHVNKNIIHAQIQQQFLLLHRPALIRFLRGEISPETYASRTKCIAAANKALSIFRDLLENPQCMPYKWYTSGLGSFHAFHAAVVLSVLLSHSESALEFDRNKETLTEGLYMFASLSECGIFCSKAVPIVRQFINVASAPLTDLQYQEQQNPQCQKFQSDTPPQTQEFTFMPPCTPSPPMADSYMVNSQYQLLMPNLGTNSDFEPQILPCQASEIMMTWVAQ